MRESKETNNPKEMKVVQRPVVQMAFTDQPFPKSFGFGLLVLVPKGVPDQFLGIARSEDIYKLVLTIISQRSKDLE
jgi:hypothetical protein